MTPILRGKLIQIPAERGAFKTAQSGLVWIRLPLVVQGTSRLLAFGMGLAPIAIIFIAGALMFAPELLRGLLGQARASDDIALGPAIAVPTCMVAGVFFGGIVAACLSDYRRRQPVLTISDDGILDTRASPHLIAWEDIARARIIHLRTGIGGVHLTLKQPGRFAYNPFRLGTMLSGLRRKPNEAFVSVALLSLPSHMLAHAIVAMVRGCGGEVETRSRFDIYGLSS